MQAHIRYFESFEKTSYSKRLNLAVAVTSFSERKFDMSIVCSSFLTLPWGLSKFM